MKTREVQSDYLHDCRNLHSEVKGSRYGKADDLEKIAVQLKKLRQSRRLTYSDLEPILDTSVWAPDQFGYWPSKEEVQSALQDQTWDFWNLPRNQDLAISKLLAIFRQIELVSVILRFIVPEHFGILSPPVEKIIGLGPFRQRHQRYAHYLDDLRAIRERRGFKDVADVEMALWVLQLGVLEGRLQDFLGQRELLEMRERHRNDELLRAIRVKNLTGEMFDDLTRPQLARALVETNPLLSAQIAGVEFECSIRRIAKRENIGEYAMDNHDGKPSTLAFLVRQLGQRKPYDKYLPQFTQAVLLRNDAVHPQGKRDFQPQRARWLVDALDVAWGLESAAQ